MSHGNTVINGDGVELCRITSHLFNFLFHNLSSLMQMSVTRNKLSERIDDGDDRFAELFTLHAVGYPQSTCSSHTATFSADSTT